MSGELTRIDFRQVLVRMLLAASYAPPGPDKEPTEVPIVTEQASAVIDPRSDNLCRRRNVS